MIRLTSLLSGVFNTIWAVYFYRLGLWGVAPLATAVIPLLWVWAATPKDIWDVTGMKASQPWIWLGPLLTLVEAVVFVVLVWGHVTIGQFLFGGAICLPPVLIAIFWCIRKGNQYLEEQEVVPPQQ